MNFGGWKTALIDIDRATEFTGDDVDQYSKLVDLGGEFESILIALPALTSSAVNVYLQEGPGVDEVPKVLHYRQSSDNATAAWGTTASTGSLMLVCPLAGGAQFIRIRAATNQAADRSVRVKGIG